MRLGPLDRSVLLVRLERPGRRVTRESRDPQVLRVTRVPLAEPDPPAQQVLLAPRVLPGLPVRTRQSLAPQDPADLRVSREISGRLDRQAPLARRDLLVLLVRTQWFLDRQGRLVQQVLLAQRDQQALPGRTQPSPVRWDLRDLPGLLVLLEPTRGSPVWWGLLAPSQGRTPTTR